jgi:ABC-type transporter Mla subunit MlaD
MTDPNFKSDRRPATPGISDTLQKTGGDIKDKASEALSATSDMAREKLDQLGSVAKDAAGQATDKIKEQVGKQQHAGADYAHRFANNLRNAAQAFDAETPIAARAIEAAASYVDDAAEKVREGSLNELMDNMTSFARRQPAAFLGLSVLAGFAAVRFLKASSGSNSRTSFDGMHFGSMGAKNVGSNSMGSTGTGGSSMGSGGTRLDGTRPSSGATELP